MKNTKLFVAIAAALALSACYKTEYGPEQKEQGKVVQLTFVPSGHGSDTAVGFSSSGNVTVTPIDIDIPARYGIVFECEHGTFALEGEKYKALWQSLKANDQVTIKYRVVYQVDEKSRRAVDLDFLGVAR